jgi:hypothetical protein
LGKAPWRQTTAVKTLAGESEKQEMVQERERQKKKATIGEKEVDQSQRGQRSPLQKERVERAQGGRALSAFP